MTDTLIELREVFVAVTPLIAGIVFLITRLTKSRKLRKLSEDYIKVEVVIENLLKNAEDFFNFSGAEKKEWVKTKVNQFCLENRIFYTENIVDETIERLINLTKNVNKREKDKEVL